MVPFLFPNEICDFQPYLMWKHHCFRILIIIFWKNLTEFNSKGDVENSKCSYLTWTETISFPVNSTKLHIKGQFNAIRTSVLPWLDQQAWNFLTSLFSPHKYSYKSLHLPKTQIQIALRKHQVHLWLTISYQFSIKWIPVAPANLPLSIGWQELKFQGALIIFEYGVFIRE